MNTFIYDAQTSMFQPDISRLSDLTERIEGQKFLVIGAAGSIGKAVTKEIFLRSPNVLHCVDISENNLVELVRDIRSSIGYIAGDFRAFALDCGSIEFDSMVQRNGPYDYILNLSALKHVRSEKDPDTLMRMLNVNIFNTLKTVRLAKTLKTKTYFSVSTDKATNPINMMGATKRIMEMFLMRESLTQKITMARFANVSYSDGSLLFGFRQRFNKLQPIVAPSDVHRYFISEKEAGELCLISCLYGENRDILFPKLNPKTNLKNFSDLAKQFIEAQGFSPFECDTEEQARLSVAKLIKEKKWPCYFFKSDTTGEKGVEEFFTDNESLNLERYKAIGVIRNNAIFNSEKLDCFSREIEKLKESLVWTKHDILEQVENTLDNFHHQETGKYLDDKM